MARNANANGRVTYAKCGDGSNMIKYDSDQILKGYTKWLKQPWEAIMTSWIPIPSS